MKLEDIGFYTLEDKRAKNASSASPYWRNELIITSRCNFKCPYCRGTQMDGCVDMPLRDIKNIIDLWAKGNMQNVRFSGGEPTLHPDIKEIVAYTKQVCKDIKHIAISTNGYNDFVLYQELMSLGVNDYSISLDACCASVGDTMAGGISGAWERVVANIRKLSSLTYVTVGAVMTKENIHDLSSTIEFAHELGVADIRIISAAQWNNKEEFVPHLAKIPASILNAHPILKYRVERMIAGENVRGISDTDSHKCGLMIDDMVIKGKYHYPCVIKMREGCAPIGVVGENMRQERYNHFLMHNSYADPICRANCLDVCIAYNNEFARTRI